MTDSFEVWDVSRWEVAAYETGGQEEKLWLIEPDTEVRWLFKPPTVKNGFRHGEDWAEKVSSHLAQLIGVPCAEVQFAARYQEQRGSLSRNLLPPDWEMQSGALLLAAADPSYRPGYMKVRGRPGHSLERIALVLAGAGAPPNAVTPQGFDAFDVFAGYMLFDAWIANRDRHDENWSILLPPPGFASGRRLCGSYDHAGALGYNVQEAACAQRLCDHAGVLKWTRKGTAHRFEHSIEAGPVTLVDHAIAALALTSASVRQFWLEQLGQVTQDTVVGLLGRVPNLSDHCRNFAGEVLRTNQGRLLDASQSRFH
ncbi:hypothetical protein [Mycobacterium sp. UM_CSW]|uniref:hypothetical protein n=1 Tax=Mycobacterium sp. UM_CSW TaxID=1370119 RepID=UPI001267BBE0|nr:hypothetical protein [Mycobacterium sp. UM_CSW]